MHMRAQTLGIGEIDQHCFAGTIVFSESLAVDKKVTPDLRWKQ